MQSGLLPHPTNNTEWNCRKEGKTCKKCKTIIIIELNRNYITREMILHMFQSMQKNHTYTVRKPMVSLWYLGVFSRICQEMWTNLHNAFGKCVRNSLNFCTKFLKFFYFIISHTPAMWWSCCSHFVVKFKSFPKNIYQIYHLFPQWFEKNCPKKKCLL